MPRGPAFLSGGVNIPTPEWIKALLTSPKPVPAPPVPEPETAPMPNPMTAEEHAADVAVDEAEVAQVLVEDPPIGVPATDLDELTPEEEAELEEDSYEPPVEGTPEPPGPPKEPRPPRRFEFAFKASSLKAFVAQIEHLVDEAKVVADKDGWHVRAVDPAHVAMVELHLTDLIDGFERVRSTNALERIDGPVEFGIDLTKMQEVLRLAKKDDVVKLDIDLPDAQDKDRITVQVGRTTRTMNALDTADMADPKLPALNLNAKLTVATQDLSEAVKACESISDHIRLTATHDGLNVAAEGDTDKVSLDLVAEVEYVQGEEGQASSLFPLDYFASFVKAARTAKVERLVMQLGTDYPIRVGWDGATKGTYLCAPRIETE